MPWSSNRGKGHFHKRKKSIFPFCNRNSHVFINSPVCQVARKPIYTKGSSGWSVILDFSVVWESARDAASVWQDRGWTGSPADRGAGTFTLNSNQAVSGAGSGIVAGPDRVRGVFKRPQGGEGWAAGTAAALGVTGCYPHRVGVCDAYEKRRGGRGRVSADFHGLQMLNMQMSDRIVQCWIGSPSWLAWGQSPAAVPGSAVVSRAAPDKMSSRSQAARWTCELELDFT